MSPLPGHLLRIIRREGRSFLGIRAWIPWIAAAVLVAAVLDPAYAQEGTPSGVRISFAADPTELTVGDLVTLTLEVTHPADHAVVVPRLPPQWGTFEVRSQTPVQTVANGDGTATTRQQLRVTLFAPGAFETPDLPISIRHPDGSLEQAYPAPVQLTVRSVLASPDELLKDIRSPSDLATPLWEQPIVRVLIVLVALAVLSAAGFLVYYRSRGREALPEPVIDTRTPGEIALDELDRIERLALPGSGRFKEHYTLVTGVIRAHIQVMYLENTDQSDAIDMTTDEIGAVLGQSSLDRGTARLVMELLMEADLVKFAHYEPPLVRAYEILDQVRNIVAATKPALDEAQPQNGAYAQRGASA